jgi:hypothetical protein
MNERIRELAEQAGLMKERATTGASVLTRAELQKRRRLEKFAELIIRDLCKVDQYCPKCYNTHTRSTHYVQTTFNCQS